MNLKSKIAIALLIFAAGILTFSFFKEPVSNSQHPGHLDPRDHVFENNLFAEYKDLKKHDALALFVVGSELCSSCINEIIEYSSAVSIYTQSSLNRFNTVKHAIIVGRDSADYKQVNYLINFPFPSSLVKRNSKLVKLLKKWKEDISGINQIVLIDLENNKVVGRIGIFKNASHS